jgi:hypothetical protein
MDNQLNNHPPISKKKKKKKKKVITYKTDVLSLQSLCILQLSDADSNQLHEYSSLFTTDIKDKFWKEVRTQPWPLNYQISINWV